MKTLKLEKNSFGLRIFCSKCDRLYNFNTVQRCKHGIGAQTYKAVVYTTGGAKAKHFETKVFDDALVQAVQFKKDVKNGVYDEVLSLPKKIEPSSISIIDGANIFLQFKHGINVPTHLKQNLTKHYLKSVEFYLGQFLDVMRKKGVNVHTLPLTELNETHVGWWTDAIREHYSEGSWNAPLRVMRLWIAFMIKKHRLPMYNPFLDVRLVAFENNVEAISENEFKRLCTIVENGTPYEQIGKGRKNRYKPYLVHAFKLALHSGLRREEFLNLKWKDVVEVESGTYTIVTTNLKVERIMERKYKKKYIPVHQELMELLIELGFEKRKAEDYIIAPERTASIKTMMSYVTKAFTHYYKQAFPEQEVKNLKVLRKTYLTYLGIAVGDDIIHFSSHSDTNVLEAHYFDKKLHAKGRNIKIFGKI